MHLVLDGVAHHQTAGAFGKEGDDFVLAVFVVFKHAFHHARLERLAINRFEIFLRGQIHQHRLAALFLQAGVEVLRDFAAPELVQIAAARIGQFDAHLQPIGLQQIQRTQHAVQTTQNAQMLLCPIQLLARQSSGRKAVVHIAIKRQHGLARIVEAGFFAPGRIAPHIEQGQFVADAHERRNLLRRLGFEQSDQLGRIAWKQGRAVGCCGSRGIVIQRLGRG